MRTVLLKEIAMTAPEDGATEGVRADSDEIDATHLWKDTVTTSAAETAKSLPILHPAKLADLHPANYCAILFTCRENFGNRIFGGPGFGLPNLRKPATPSP